MKTWVSRFSPGSPGHDGDKEKLPRRLRYGALAIIGLAAAVFIVLPCRNILQVYAWHVRQPEFVEGGSELLVLFASLCLLICIIRNARASGCVIVGATAVYLQVHSILVPAAAALFYVEILLQVGAVIEKKLAWALPQAT